MKNPLVDALRQANVEIEEDICDSGSKPDFDKVLPITDGIGAVEQVLDLVESAALPESEDPAASADDSEIQSSEALPVRCEIDMELASDDKTQILPILDEQDCASESARATLPDVASVSRPVSGIQRSHHWVSRIGRWSPIIMMLVLSSAAGAYALYQYLTVTNLNYDLSEMTLRAGSDVRSSANTDDWNDLPENNVVSDSAGYVQLSPISNRVMPTVTVANRHKSSSPDAQQSVIPKTREALQPVNDPVFADIRSGYTAYQAGDYARAEKHYANALAVDPNHRQALAGFAAVLQVTSSPTEWIPVYEKLLEVDPQNTVAISVLLAHEVTGDAQQKETRLRVLLQKHPKVAELHLALGLLAGERERWADARLAFLEAHNVAPENSNYSFNAAVSMEHLGRYDEARIYYQLAMDTAGKNPLVNPEFVAAQIEKMTNYSGLQE